MNFRVPGGREEPIRCAEWISSCPPYPRTEGDHFIPGLGTGSGHFPTRHLLHLQRQSWLAPWLCTEPFPTGIMALRHRPEPSVVMGICVAETEEVPICPASGLSSWTTSEGRPCDVKSHSLAASWLLEGSALGALLSFLLPELAKPPQGPLQAQCPSPSWWPQPAEPQTLTRHSCSGLAPRPGHLPPWRAEGLALWARQVKSGFAGGESRCEEHSQAAACFVAQEGHRWVLHSGDRCI